MNSTDEFKLIRWKVHLKSSPESVFAMLATNDGRARFWAEEATERNGYIHFRFPNGASWRGKILESESPRRFSVEYYGSSVCTFELQEDEDSGTDLTLTDEGIAIDDLTEVSAGWVSVLMAFKAAVDFNVDLRNHDAQRTWDDGYADN